MIKRYAFAALATIGVGIAGFAPASSAQSLGGCADPEVCGFINESGFSMIGFANGTFGFIDGGGSPSFGTNSTSTAAAAPVVTPAPSTGLGQWSFGSPNISTRSFAALPTNLRLADSAEESTGGFDAAAVAPIAIGLLGVYGVLMLAVRRHAGGGAAA